MIDLYHFKPGFRNADGNCLPYQELWNGSCVPKCTADQARDAGGICRNKIGYDWIGRQTIDGKVMTAIHTTVPHGLMVRDRIVVNSLNGTWNRSGVYTVRAIADVDDGSYYGTLIVIDQAMAARETSSGYVMKVYAANYPTVTPRVSLCDPGYELVNGKCVPKCASNQERINGICKTKCDAGYERDSKGNCVQKCTTGQVRISGVCVTPDPGVNNCQEGYVKLGGECIEIDKPFNPAGFLENLPSWAKYVALAAGAGILIFSIVKTFKH